MNTGGDAVSSNELLDLLGSILASAKKAEGNDPVERERCIDGLKSLLKFKVTTKLLSETQAGKRVRTLSKHTVPDIASIASKTVSAWKEIVRQESTTVSQDISRAPSTTTTPAPTPVPAAAPSDDPGSQAAAAEPSPVKETTIFTTTTTPNMTAIDMPQTTNTTALMLNVPETGDTVRDKIRKNLAAALCIAVEEGAHAGDPVDVAVRIENRMYSDLEGVSAKYKAKFRQLHFNLKDAKNPDLRRKVLEGDIQPDVLLILQPEELASNAQREENQKIRDKKLFDAAPSAVKHATTDQFRCGKCGKRECTYYQMQTRSADEPATTYVTCTNCLNRWKFC